MDVWNLEYGDGRVLEFYLGAENTSEVADWDDIICMSGVNYYCTDRSILIAMSSISTRSSRVSILMSIVDMSPSHI